MTTDEVKELMDKGLITQVINPVDVVNNMETEPGPCDYKLPIASADVLGGVKVGTGDGLTIDNGGNLGVKIGSGLCYSEQYPGVRIKTGNGLGLTADGSLYVDGNGSGYTLPTASETTLGGVKVGDGLTIDDNGALHTTMAGSAYNPNVKLGGVKVGTNIGNRDGVPYAKIGINSTTGEIGLNYGDGLKTNSTMGAAHHSALEINYGAGLGIESDGKLKVKVGKGLSIGSSGELDVTVSDYRLGTASKDTLGGVKIGTGLYINNLGEIGATYATKNTSGMVKIGDGLYMKDNNWISVNCGTGLSIGNDQKLYVTATGGSDYELPTASETTLGGVIVGKGLSASLDGEVAVNIGTGFGWNNADGFYVEFSQAPTATTTTRGVVMVGTGLYNSSTDNHVKLGIDNGVAGVNYGQGIRKDSSQRLLVDIDYVYEQILTKLRNDGYIQ